MGYYPDLARKSFAELLHMQRELTEKLAAVDEILERRTGKEEQFPAFWYHGWFVFRTVEEAIAQFKIECPRVHPDEVPYRIETIWMDPENPLLDAKY